MAAAGLWVKVAATLPRHYKTENLARALSLPIHEVVGKLVSLWIYAVEFANAGLLTEDDIRRGFFSADEPADEESVKLVADALCECGGLGHEGFLERWTLPEEDGGSDGPAVYALHDWPEYSGSFQPGGDSSYKNRGESKRKKKTDLENAAPANDDGTARKNETPPADKKAGNEGKSEPALKPPKVVQPLLNSAGQSYADVRARLLAQLRTLDN